jgi:hypothetical protein
LEAELLGAEGERMPRERAVQRCGFCGLATELDAGQLARARAHLASVQAALQRAASAQAAAAHDRRHRQRLGSSVWALPILAVVAGVAGMVLWLAHRLAPALGRFLAVEPARAERLAALGAAVVLGLPMGGLLRWLLRGRRPQPTVAAPVVEIARGACPECSAAVPLLVGQPLVPCPFCGAPLSAGSEPLARGQGVVDELARRGAASARREQRALRGERDRQGRAMEKLLGISPRSVVVMLSIAFVLGAVALVVRLVRGAAAP